MKKRILYCLIILIIACANVFASYLKQGGETVYGKNGIPMPEWASRMYLEDDDYHYVVGSYKMPSKQASISRAQAWCTAEVARQIGVVAKVLVENYMSVAGNAGTMEYEQLEVFVDASVQKSKSMVKGLKRFDMWEAMDGEVYVLMGMPMENLKNAMEEVLSGEVKAAKKKNSKEALKALNAFQNFMNTDFEKAFAEVFLE